MKDIPLFIIVSYLGAIALTVYPMIRYYTRKRKQPTPSVPLGEEEIDYIKQWEDSPDFPGKEKRL